MHQYFSTVTQVCRPCPQGQEFVDGAPVGAECAPCNQFSAGVDGICLECPAGRQATPDRTSCDTCPVGFAGTNGRCDACMPGTAQKADQSGCYKCMPGTYRNMEVVSECMLCPEGMISDSADLARTECFCPGNKYDLLDRSGQVSPIWCLPNGLQTAPQQLDENRISVKDVRLEARCVRCPACLNCSYPGFHGTPFVLDGWTVANPDLPKELPRETSSLGSGYYNGKPRYIFGCPFGETIDNIWQGGSCVSEYDFRNNGSTRLRNCTEGYTGYLCAQCEDNYMMKDDACDICEAAEQQAALFLAVMLGFFFSVLIVIPMLKRNDSRREKIDAGVKVVRSMATDVKVFVAVYQVFSAMGQSLRIKFPRNIELFIQFMRTFVDLDLTSIPGLGCLLKSNYYDKLYSALIVPLFFMLLIYFFYWRGKRALRYKGYKKDEELDRRARAVRFNDLLCRFNALLCRFMLFSTAFVLKIMDLTAPQRVPREEEQVSKKDEFSFKNEEFCIKNEDVCI